MGIMKRILLIDADSTIPNLALMKLSSYYKAKGYEIRIQQLHLPYFPNRKKSHFSIITEKYEKVYCSVIFEKNKEYIHGENIIFGGTGVDLETKLKDEIENMHPDYSIYPYNDTSYGFITRGCIRNCYFCKVPKKEGKIHKVAEVEDIIRHKKVKFMDNNILGYEKHLYELNKISEIGIKCQFNQGLDIRLVNKENSEALSKLNYWKEYIFAFDDWKYKKILDKKLSLLHWVKDWRLKFFVYIHPNMELQETILRIKYLKERKCLPYIMRDISCWYSQYHGFYVDLAAWCNQVHIFKTMNFEEFLNKRHKNINRIETSLKLWNAGGNYEN